MEQKKEKKYLVDCIICGLLTALVLGSNAYMLLFEFSGNIRDVVRLADVTLVLLTAFYAIIEYKKPHGNLLKILMLIFTVSVMTEALRDAADGWTLHAVLDMICMIFIAYVAGRLDRIKQNRYLMSSILLLLLVARVVLEFVCIPSVDLIVFIGRSSKAVVWLDICVAYFLRYKQHKEAGLEDAPKSK